MNNLKINRPLAAALGLAVLAVAPAAYAADVVYQEPPVPAAPMEIAPVNTWSGPYAGVSLGYGFSGNTDVSNGAGSVGISTDGWMGGAFGGFQQQNGSFVYGAEADINYSRVKGSVGDPLGVTGSSIESRTSVDGSIRGRAGVTVTEDILLYGTAGLAAERQRVTASDGIDSVRDTQTLLGYTVGAGVDARLTEQVFGRLEYRYTDYGSRTYDFGGIGSADVGSSNHRVSVGLGVKF